AGAARVDRIEQRDADIVDQVHAGERPRQLEAARQAETGALMRGEAIDGTAVETHGTSFIVQRAADAIDQRALAGAVRADEAEALANRHVERDILQRDEAAEAFAEIVDFEQVGRGAFSLGALSHGTDPGASVSMR